MRQGGPSGRRPRGRQHSGGSGSGNNGGGRPPRTASSLRHQTFDSNGPDVRVRGNAWQVYEKYIALARDAQGAGDRVLAESLFQHAEHYFRVTEAINDATSSEQQKRAPEKPNVSEQQPEVPSNYYAPDGQLMEAKKAAQSQVPQSQVQQPRASQLGENRKPREMRPPRRSSAPPPQESQPQKQAPAPDPFFAKDSEADDQGSGPQKLVAGS